MPESPDFKAIACLIYVEATGETLFLEEDIAPIVEQLRLVWNARGAADIAKVDTTLTSELSEFHGPPAMAAKALDRALRSLDR